MWVSCAGPLLVDYAPREWELTKSPKKSLIFHKVQEGFAPEKKRKILK